MVEFMFLYYELIMGALFSIDNTIHGLDSSYNILKLSKLNKPLDMSKKEQNKKGIKER